MITPVQDKVIVKLIEIEKKTASGLFISKNKTKDNELEKAEVVAVGPGRTTKDGKLLVPQVEIGDIVAYQKSTGIQTKIDNEEFVVLTEQQILAIILE